MCFAELLLNIPLFKNVFYVISDTVTSLVREHPDYSHFVIFELNAQPYSICIENPLMRAEEINVIPFRHVLFDFVHFWNTQQIFYLLLCQPYKLVLVHQVMNHLKSFVGIL